jgi:shikimate kinase
MTYYAVKLAGKSIVLVGMMGAGKSCVGRCLQWRTKAALVDTDDIVASRFGISISEIFSKYGEQGFREAETQVLRELAPPKQTIIVTGGGIVLRGKNLDFLKRLGVIVWLDGNEEKLFERASQARTRPLLQGENPRETFTQLLQLRLPLYAKLAHIRVDTSVLTDEEVAMAVLSKLKKLGGNRRPGSSASAEATADKSIPAAAR